MRRAAIALAGGLAIWSCGDDGNLGPRADHLAFAVQPSTTISDQILTPPVEVAIEDAAGTVIGTADDAVSLRLVGPPTGPNLSGTLTVNAVEGVATFSDLRVSVPGSGYILQAGAEGFIEVPSIPFDVSPHPSGMHPGGMSPPQPGVASNLPAVILTAPSRSSLRASARHASDRSTAAYISQRTPLSVAIAITSG